MKFKIMDNYIQWNWMVNRLQHLVYSFINHVLNVIHNIF